MSNPGFTVTPQPIRTGYGLCPICHGKGVSCERCPDGDTFCENGHNYPHTQRVYEETLPGASNLKQRITDRRKRHDKPSGHKMKLSDPVKGIAHAVNPRQEGEGGPRSVDECLLFLSDNINEECDVISAKFKNFEHKDQLREMINHLLITNMGGWYKEENCLMHISGRMALCEHWDVTDDGHLCAKGKKYRQIDSDKLYKFMEACND